MNRLKEAKLKSSSKFFIIMALKRVIKLVGLVATASALLAGLLKVWADLPGIASRVWLIGAHQAFLMLFYEVVVALSRRQSGVEHLALLSIAGLFSLDETLTGIVIATADKNNCADIVRMVTAAQASKAPSMRIADRYAL